jgi:hypothetical protein
MSDPNSLDDLLASVAARGLKLANLFQFENIATGEWKWQANVTDGERHWEYGRGETAVQALRAALFRSANEEGVVVKRTQRVQEPPAPKGPVIADIDL